MVELVEQVRRRFKKVQEKSLKSLEFLIPSNAVKCVPPTLLGVYECFKFLKDVAPIDLVDLEWRKQAIEETDDTGNVGSDTDFWKKTPFSKRTSW